MNLSFYKSAIEATPEQGEQLPLFNEDTFPTGKFKVGDKVWWNGLVPFISSKEMSNHGSGWVYIGEPFTNHHLYGEGYRVTKMPGGGSWLFLNEEDLFWSKPKIASLKLGVEATPEQGEQLPLFNEDTFPTDFRVGDKVYWNGSALDCYYSYEYELLGGNNVEIITIKKNVYGSQTVYRLDHPVYLWVLKKEISYSPIPSVEKSVEEFDNKGAHKVPTQTFSGGKFHVGDKVWWDGMYPLDAVSNGHGVSGMVEILSELEKKFSDYGYCYFIKTNTGKTWYVKSESLSKEKPKIASLKLGIQAIPEQGEQLPLFNEESFGFKVGDIVWWNGRYPASGGMVGMAFSGWVRVKTVSYLNQTYGEMQRVVIFDKGGDRFSMLVKVVDLFAKEPKIASLKLGVQATPEQGEQLALFDNITFPTTNIKYGDLVWSDTIKRRGTVIQVYSDSGKATIFSAYADGFVTVPLNTLKVLHSYQEGDNFHFGDTVLWNGKYVMGENGSSKLQYVDDGIIKKVMIITILKASTDLGMVYFVETVNNNSGCRVWPENLSPIGSEK